MVSFTWRKAFTGLAILSTSSSVVASPTATSATAASTTSYHPLFSIPAEADIGQSIIPNIEDPEAVNAQDVCPGYKASNVQKNKYGFTAALTLAGPACNVYGDDVQSLDLTMQYESADRLNLQIVPSYVTDQNRTWFILPSELVHKAGLDSDAAHTISHNDLEFNWGNSPSFWFSVTRKSVGDVLFSTQGTKLVFENQFLEFKTALPKDYNLYGLGETIRPFRLGNNYTKTMYNSDNADTVDRNIYGTHPIYYDTRYYEKSGHKYIYVPTSSTTANGTYKGITHGVYLRNAHGQEILMQNSSVTWRTIGGSIDLTFFSGPSIADVARSYQRSSIGLPAMQQYYTLGYHQCRWGYSNWTQMEGVVSDFDKFGIPLETMWSDIDYMQLFRDFSTDIISYPLAEGQAFMSRLHAAGKHYVPITDSAIYHPNPANASDAYATFERGNAANAFLHNPDGSLYIGAVWPGYTVFPDWLSAGASSWWTNEVTTFHRDGLPFDGLWIDMSEVSSFCVGSCGSNNLTLNPAPGGIPTAPPTEYPEGFASTNASDAASASSYASAYSATASPAPVSQTTSYLRSTPTPGARNINYPPYALNNILGDLATHAVSPNATHSDALATPEYDVHNLWGYQILNATYHALAAAIPGKRPFIIGRSTFAGAGSVAGHWGGDNSALWYYMVFSIPQALSMSLFGIPMFGVDACGFQGNTDEELCSRWMQLAAFFPFYRNHNTYLAISQEPYRWAGVASATKTAMDVRYALLPYMYTLMEHAHERGDTVMRALAWEFPNDPALADAYHQFLLGPSVLVTPVLEQGASSVNGVFPGVTQGERWYDWYNRSAIVSPQALSGANTTLSAPLGTIPVHVRGGAVLPLQPRGDALVTRDMRTKPWEILVALDKDGKAAGSLYLDDGESVSPAARKDVSFGVKGGKLTVATKGKYTAADGMLGKVSVMGLAKKPAQVSYKAAGQKSKAVQFTYDQSKGLLDVSLGEVAWSGKWELVWS